MPRKTLLASVAVAALVSSAAFGPPADAQVIGGGVFGGDAPAGGGATCPSTPSACMYAPIFFTPANAASATATNYDILNAGAGGQSWSGTEGTHRSAVATSGLFQNLALATNTTFASGTETADIFKNGATGGVLTCSFTNVSGGSIGCVDTTHTVAGSPTGNSGNADFFSARSVPATLANTINLFAGMEYVDQTATQEAPIFLGGWASGTVAAGQYFGVGAAMAPTSTEINVSGLVPGDVCDGITPVGTIDKLTVQLTTTSAAATWGLFVTVNGVDSAIECDTVAASAVCNPKNASSVALKCGDTLSVHATQLTGTVTASVMSGSIRWRPVTTGQYPLFNMGVPPVATPRYASISGNIGAGVSTEANVFSLMPSAHSYKFSDLIFAFSTTPGGVTKRKVTVKSGTSATAQTASSITSGDVSSGTVTLGGALGAFPGAVDLTHTLTMSTPSTAATPQYVDLQFDNTGSAAVVTWGKVSMMVQKQ